MTRIVRVDEPLRDTDTDLTSGYLERVDLRDLDLTGHIVDDLSIIDADVQGLLLPEGAGWVYIRRSRGLMRVRQAPDPLNHHEVASLYLRRAQEAVSQRERRIARIAADIGQWVMDDPRTSWVPGWAVYGEKYGEKATDEAVKFVCANHPNLLAHWEWAKAQPSDPQLVGDQELTLLLKNGPITLDSAFLRSLTLAGPPDDRWELARYVEAFLLSNWPDPKPQSVNLYIASVEPFNALLRTDQTDPLWWREKIG